MDQRIDLTIPTTVSVLQGKDNSQLTLEKDWPQTDWKQQKLTALMDSLFLDFSKSVSGYSKLSHLTIVPQNQAPVWRLQPLLVDPVKMEMKLKIVLRVKVYHRNHPDMNFMEELAHEVDMPELVSQREPYLQWHWLLEDYRRTFPMEKLLNKLLKEAGQNN